MCCPNRTVARVAAVTRDAVTELGLTTGSAVVALIKATELSLATV
ncbi:MULTISPECIES: TOBE domain-containing protein [Kitasatospora]